MQKTLEIIDWNSQKTLFNKNLESVGFMCVFGFFLQCCVPIIKSGLKWQDLNQPVHFQTLHVQKPSGKFPVNSSELGKTIILNNNTRVLSVLSSQFPTCSSSARLKVNHNSFYGRYSIHWKWSAFPRGTAYFLKKMGFTT